MSGEAPSQRAVPAATMPRPRIQTLSDLIFGLALSISALTLVGQQPTNMSDLGFALGLYGFSFLVLISVWRLYSMITSVLPSEGSMLLNLNILLLFFVSIEPYLFNELFAGRSGMYLGVSGLYGLDLAAMFFIIAFFTHSLVNEEKNLVPKSLLGRYRAERDITLIVAILFTVSVIPFFGTTTPFVLYSGGNEFDFTIRSLIWIVCLFFGWGMRSVNSRRTPATQAVSQQAKV